VAPHRLATSAMSGSSVDTTHWSMRFTASAASMLY
jgi:hypothetical protein